VYFEFKSGPGKLTNTGAIQPDGKAAIELTVPFKHYEAQRLALAILAHLQAWEVIRLWTHRHSASRFPTYELAPAAENSAKTTTDPNRPVMNGLNQDQPENRKPMAQPPRKGVALPASPTESGATPTNHVNTTKRMRDMNDELFNR
jgi:hypothetical protein